MNSHEVLAVQMYVLKEIKEFKKTCKDLNEAKKEFKAFLKRLLKSKFKPVEGERELEKLVYAIFLINIYPELKSIKFRSPESDTEQSRRWM